MRKGYKRLGEYIQPVNIRNKDLEVKLLLGVSITKRLIPSIANTIGSNMANYKIIERNQFAYGPVTSRNGEKISVGLLDEADKAIISQSYTVFEIIDTNKLLPIYLMMWFSRPEFDRYARYHSHGSTRETFSWEEMCNVELPIPSIEKQREIVAEYQAVENKIKTNEQICEKLEATAQALYRHWFVDFEFPNEEDLPYKSSGGAMVYNEELEKKIPEGWEVNKLKNISQYSPDRVKVPNLNLGNYISTENMLQNKGGVTISSGLPTTKTVAEFKQHDILISNIRPYFKKIWLTEFQGGCSNDVLCFKSKINPFFIYYTLEKDDFFDYIMKGTKGTKMPRGDKKWIMNYLVVTPTFEVLQKYGDAIEKLDTYSKNLKREGVILTHLLEILLSKIVII